jgi:hypothetical protein
MLRQVTLLVMDKNEEMVQGNWIVKSKEAFDKLMLEQMSEKQDDEWLEWYDLEWEGDLLELQR